MLGFFMQIAFLATHNLPTAKNQNPTSKICTKGIASSSKPPHARSDPLYSPGIFDFWKRGIPPFQNNLRNYYKISGTELSAIGGSQCCKATARAKPLNDAIRVVKKIATGAAEYNRGCT